MKISIINYYDQKGGAAIAARRLCEALRLQGIEANMLVAVKSRAEKWIYGPVKKLDKAKGAAAIEIDQLYTHYFYPNKKDAFFTHSTFSFTNILETALKDKPDILHLHWISGSLFKIKELKQIKLPIIWSLHDMWAFTGGCHYNGTCEKFKSICNRCPVLESQKNADLSNRIFNKKNRSYNPLNLHIIGLSRWISMEAKNSALLQDKPIYNLPNCIDTDAFKPIDINFSRTLFNLPKDKRLILFGAMNATSDPRKGFNYIQDALSRLDNSKYELVIFGASKPKDRVFNFTCHYLGNLHDETTLVTLYSAVDIFLLPSVQENLSNMVLESLSCGTPVVAFDIGGNKDMIDHQQNGYLAKPYDANDFALGIEWTIANKDSCSEQARKKVINQFSYSVVAKKYINLYKSILRLD